ncbi:MAG: hypothetical protein K0R99_5004 [Microbacterium sp.]|jgi:hypothetical protein|uniref:hypothetical protein n=1 Tax=Microbacterium sp. TaxID=51671 RepID=UPI00262AA4BA|nr:hypothetical protein [Microbacterium sp.]MDF2563558.1 hypothetical protein [Microbacterium sp.]
MKRSRLLAAAGAGCLIAGLMPAVASATDTDLTPGEVIAAVQEVAAQPNTGPIETAETFAVTSDDTLVLESDRTQVSIDLGESPIIELTSDLYEPLYIEGGLSDAVSTEPDGAVVFSTEDSYSVAPLPYEDGSVQLINVLADSSAPERFEYSFSSSTPVSISLHEGMAVIVDAEGNYVGGVTAPWAYDSVGAAVPTHFEVDGNTLVQVVEHAAGNYSYPVTADPYAGQMLFQWATIDTYNGDKRVNLQPTNYGRGVVPWVMTGAGWSEAMGWGQPYPIGPTLGSKATLRQQFDCHAFGNAFAGVWNLERFRPNRTTDWPTGVAIHRCNWTSADRY